ncbi:hypothetical protein E2H98_07330 [Permianibacter aggregans]|nr:hypothetical protein E2H98_07330 [Permianibacter aggregans]
MPPDFDLAQHQSSWGPLCHSAKHLWPPPFAAQAADQKQGETRLPEVKVTAEQEAPAYKPEEVSSPKFTAPLRDTSVSVTVVPRWCDAGRILDFTLLELSD